jgi:hypothetical protein
MTAPRAAELIALAERNPERFIIRKSHEWAFIFIDEETGVQRRDGSLSREEARSAWDDLPGVDANTIESFFSRGFWKVIWPELLVSLRTLAGQETAR